jgi:hypothetical protein
MTGGMNIHVCEDECARDEEVAARPAVTNGGRGRGQASGKRTRRRCVSAKCAQPRMDAELTRRSKEVLVVGKPCVLVSGAKRAGHKRAANIVPHGMLARDKTLPSELRPLLVPGGGNYLGCREECSCNRQHIFTPRTSGDQIVLLVLIGKYYDPELHFRIARERHSP